MIDLSTPVEGPVDLNAHELFAFIKAKTKGTKLCYGDADLERFCIATVESSRETGIRASIDAAQMMHETNWLRYGGQVQCGSHNFAGIGSVNGGAAGRSFKDIPSGIKAVFAHHMNYLVGKRALWPARWDGYRELAVRNQAVLDAGYGGVVTTIGDYTNGRWAWSPQYPTGTLLNGYATSIVALANEMRAGSSVLAQREGPVMIPEKGATMGRVPKPPIEDLIDQTTRNKVNGVGFDYGAPREPVGTTLHSMAGTLESCIGYFPGRDVEALTDYGIGNVPHKGTPFARIVQFNKVDGGTMIPWASGPVGPSRNNPNGRPEGDGPRFIAQYGIGGINSRLASIEHDDSTHPDGHVETYIDGAGKKRVNPNAPTHAAQWAASIWLQAWRHDLAGQTADTFDWNMHHCEFVGRNYKTCPRERITDFTDEYQSGIKAIMRHLQEGAPYPAGGIVINGLRIATPPEGNVATSKPTISDILKEARSKPTPTGHTIHPFSHTLWSLEMDGYPVLPAVGYTDGKVRQVFDNSLMEANADGSGARRGGLGQAFVRLSGGNYPDWEQIHPQVA